MLAALLLLPLPVSGGPAWDLGAALGYLSVVFAVLLYLYPLRGHSVSGEPLAHRRRLPLSQHRRFGWIALALALLHTLCVLAVQPLTANYLRPSAPLYMSCGIGALALLAILVPTGIATRKSMRRRSGGGALGVVHAILAAALLGLLGAHLLGSGQFLDTPPKAITACLLLALPLLWSALRAYAQRSRTQQRPIMVVSLLVAGTLLLMPASMARLLEPVVARTEPLPVRFPHELHTGVGCIACHHNFRDTTGSANCIDCHRSARQDLPHSSEATFHVFCRTCHRELALEGKRHGPTRACQPCHQR